MNNFRKMKSGLTPRQRGFSIVELLVAMVLGLFLLAALVEILLSGKESFNSANHLSRLQENGRIATNLLVTDLKRSGYMGGNSDIPNIFGSEGKSDPDTTCAAGDTSWGRMVTQRIFGLDDTSAGYACVPASYLRGDILTVRYASPWLAAAPLQPNQLYLRSSLFRGKVFAGANEGQGTNLVTEQPQSVHDLVAHAFFVGNSGRTCSGQPVPSLFRIRLDPANGQPLVEELLPGVEDFQVQYGIGGQYVDADAIVDIEDWDDVVTAQIWLLIRSECPDSQFLDNGNYTMGDQPVYSPADNYRRQLYSSVVMLRN